MSISSQYMQQANYIQQQQWPAGQAALQVAETPATSISKQQSAGAKQKVVRRSRQPRNPQLSVARRNERERNRVKMVNRGFADLRERLHASFVSVSSSSVSSHSSADSPAPTEHFSSQAWDSNSQYGSLSEHVPVSPSKSTSCGDKKSEHQDAKAKKYSKVETLRAATQYIKQLTEILRQQEALDGASGGGSQELFAMASSMDEQLADALTHDDSPSSYAAFADNPPSNSTCSNSNSNSGSQTQQQSSYVNVSVPISNKKFVSTTIPSSTGQTIQWNSSQNCLVQTSSNATTSTLPQNTFIKLEPQSNSQQSQRQPHQQPQPQQQAFSPHQNYNTRRMSPSEDQSSHTHIWIEQHQTSFMEQQQIYQQQQQHQWQFEPSSDLTQQSSVSSASPCSSTATNQTTTTATSSANQQQQQQQQSNHYDWYPTQQQQSPPAQASSPGYLEHQNQQQYQQPRQQVHHNDQQQMQMHMIQQHQPAMIYQHPQHQQQQHQISLY